MESYYYDKFIFLCKLQEKFNIYSYSYYKDDKEDDFLLTKEFEIEIQNDTLIKKDNIYYFNLNEECTENESLVGIEAVSNYPSTITEEISIENNSNIPSVTTEKILNIPSTIIKEELFSNISTITEEISNVNTFDTSFNIPSTIIKEDLFSNTSTITEEISKFNTLDTSFNIPFISTLPYYNKEEDFLTKLNEILIDKQPGVVYNIKKDNYSILIRPSNSSIEPNITYINFSECESVLRDYHKIPNSSIITILQLELYNNNSKSLINQVEYQVYDQNFTKLNLKLCNGTNIQIIYSIKDDILIDTEIINSLKDKGVDPFNINDSFFWDVCQPFSDMGNDLILEDRIRDFYQNYSLCEEGCTYNSINIKNMTVSCNCKIKENITTVISEINFDKIKYETTSNFEIIKCYNIIFEFKIKKNNIGFWIFSILIFLNILFLIIYFNIGISPVYLFVINQMAKYGYYVKNIKNKLKTIKKSNNMNNPPLKNKKNLTSKNKNNKNNIVNNFIIIKHHSIKDKNKKNNKIKNNGKSKNRKKYNNNSKNSTNSKILMNKNNKSIKLENMPTQNPEEKNQKNIVDFPLITIYINKKNKCSYIPKNSNRILNNYTFKEAIKYDHRSLCQIFFIYLISKQILFHAFLFRSPFEIFPLRLCLLIFIFSSDLALNAFFYFNDNISKKYHYAKNLFLFTFSNNITVILLSTFVGFIILTLFIKLSNSTNSLREVFRNEEEKIKKNKKYKVTEKRKIEIKNEIEGIFKTFKIKIIILIFSELILIIFFWYYVTIFCHVFPSTQTSWLLDSFLSMLSRFIIDALICLGLAKLYRIGVDSNVNCIYNCAMFLYGF